MSGLIGMIRDSGNAGLIILCLAGFALAIIIERLRAFYVSYNFKTGNFVEKIKSLIFENKMEEAITLCGQYSQKPLANVFKTILERSDREDEAIYQAQEIALNENVPLFSKRLGYLMMISNVATLVGLLGTINGLIMSFKAVANADPSAKQTLLAEGISLAMNTTALGLMVAIPTMIVFSFLQAKQSSFSEQVIEQSGKLVEIVTNRHYKKLKHEEVYTENNNGNNNGSNPPPSYKKAI